jgi:hypothetical protein
MTKLYKDLSQCAMCDKGYDETHLGKSIFSYKHPEIEEAKEFIVFKICKICRHRYTLAEIMKKVIGNRE